MRRKNPTQDIAMMAAGTALGIVVGTVIATYIVENMRAGGIFPGGGAQLPPPSVTPSSGAGAPSSFTAREGA